MIKREIEITRIKTQINETAHQMNMPYPSVKKAAEERMKFLQEEYKIRTGEYFGDYKLDETEGKYPELNKLVEKLAAEFSQKINDETAKIESKMPYKAQYVLEELIKNLQARV